MSFHTHCVCDNCEHDLEADNEDLSLGHGWFILRYVREEEEHTRDFCSIECLTVWASKGELEPANITAWSEEE